MHLYLSVYLHFYATVLLKQYLISNYTHLLKKYMIILNFKFSLSGGKLGEQL